MTRMNVSKQVSARSLIRSRALGLKKWARRPVCQVSVHSGLSFSSRLMFWMLSLMALPFLVRLM